MLLALVVVVVGWLGLANAIVLFSLWFFCFLKDQISTAVDMMMHHNKETECQTVAVAATAVMYGERKARKKLK